MHTDSIFYHFDRTQLGSLHRRHNAIVNGNPNRDAIVMKDLELIFANDKRCLADSLFQEYNEKALRGLLKPPRGRRPVHIPSIVLEALDEIIKEDAKAIAIARKSGRLKRSRADLSPAEAAADDLGGIFGNISGRTLLNKISAHRKRKH